MTPDLIIAITWLACGVLAYGFNVADASKNFEQFRTPNARVGLRLAFLMDAVLGPLSLYASWYFTKKYSGRPFKHGWML